MFAFYICQTIWFLQTKSGAEAPLSLSNNPKFQARFRVMSFVLAKNVYKLIKALYW